MTFGISPFSGAPFAGLLATSTAQLLALLARVGADFKATQVARELAGADWHQPIAMAERTLHEFLTGASLAESARLDTGAALVRRTDFIFSDVTARLMLASDAGLELIGSPSVAVVESSGLDFTSALSPTANAGIDFVTFGVRIAGQDTAGLDVLSALQRSAPAPGEWWAGVAQASRTGLDFYLPLALAERTGADAITALRVLGSTPHLESTNAMARATSWGLESTNAQALVLHLWLDVPGHLIIAQDMASVEWALNLQREGVALAEAIGGLAQLEAALAEWTSLSVQIVAQDTSGVDWFSLVPFAIYNVGADTIQLFLPPGEGRRFIIPRSNISNPYSITF